MEALYLLVPLSLIAVLVAIVLFFRMSATGQFDDDQGPAFSVLLDDDRPPLPPDETDVTPEQSPAPSSDKSAR
ncbi:MAG: cbb3-type cytochrome oxidase assembly protein CcoS [Gammaproteobacteria bacterium]|nr:MAG: cbb3-type cytochrome oxidase assembly protein CcoS [Gammaproteobacteria bacterium]